MRFFIRLAYCGTPFHGWQRQPGGVATVQQRLEEALSRLLGHEMAVTGAGRTDTGVHARVMYAHFDVETLRLPPSRIAAALNTMCGPDIAVGDVFEVAPELHARFSAVSREYRYFLHVGKNPFLDRQSLRITAPLDVDAFNAGAEMLKATSDFTSFAKLHSDARTNICRVSHAMLRQMEPATSGPRYVFEIKADRFLRNMVRAVTGTLVDIGRGRLSLDVLRDVIDARDRCAASASMPAHALYLWDVKYPGF